MIEEQSCEIRAKSRVIQGESAVIPKKSGRVDVEYRLIEEESPLIADESPWISLERVELLRKSPAVPLYGCVSLLVSGEWYGHEHLKNGRQSPSIAVGNRLPAVFKVFMPLRPKNLTHNPLYQGVRSEIPLHP